MTTADPKHVVWMASHQAPGGGTSGQDHHSSMARAKANTFHHFLAMPVELQDVVWEEALESPGVLCVTVNFTWGLEDQKHIMSFTPDAHAVASTRNQRALLRTCRNARRNALRFLTILTLYRLNPSKGKITEYNMPFDSGKTCLCVDGWNGLGICPDKMRKVKGLTFARDVKRLAIVVHDKFIKNGTLDFSPMSDSVDFDDLRGVAFLFHNSLNIAGVTTSSLKIRKFLGDEAFASLFSFQPFVQKGLVEGFYLTKPHSVRHKILDDAIRSSFEGWNGRIRAALHQAGLLSILERINLAVPIKLRNGCRPYEAVESQIDGAVNAVPYLIQQAIREGVGTNLYWRYS